MRHLTLVYFFLGSLSAFAGGFPPWDVDMLETSLTQGQVYQTPPEGIDLLDSQDSNPKILRRVSGGLQVTLVMTGQKAERASSPGKAPSGRWIKVRTRDNAAGWVFDKDLTFVSPPIPTPGSMQTFRSEILGIQFSFPKAWGHCYVGRWNHDRYLPDKAKIHWMFFSKEVWEPQDLAVLESWEFSSPSRLKPSVDLQLEFKALKPKITSFKELLKEFQGYGSPFFMQDTPEQWVLGVYELMSYAHITDCRLTPNPGGEAPFPPLRKSYIFYPKNQSGSQYVKFNGPVFLSPAQAQALQAEINFFPAYPPQKDFPSPQTLAQHEGVFYDLVKDIIQSDRNGRQMDPQVKLWDSWIKSIRPLE